MTDVPYGRGGSPLQNLIVRRHDATVISALRCVRELDAGPVYMKRPLGLHGSAEEIFLRADAIIEDMIVAMIRDQPEAVAQTGEVVTFTRRRPDQGDLRDAKSLDAWYDLIRMLDAEGYPHAFLDVGDFRIEFSRVGRRTAGLQADVVIRKRPTETKV
jgi:methionyl-tRNA formyltransferase